MSRDEFVRIDNAADGQGLYFWDPETCCKTTPLGKIPWPIIWLLSFHYKHIFTNNKKPPIRHIAKAIGD